MAQVVFAFLFSHLVDDKGIEYIGNNIKDQVCKSVRPKELKVAMEKNKRMPMWLKQLIDKDEKTKKEDEGVPKVTHGVEKAWMMKKVEAQVQETQRGKKGVTWNDRVKTEKKQVVMGNDYEKKVFTLHLKNLKKVRQEK